MKEKQFLTVSQIAEFICRPHEEMVTVVDRIRGWADVGLLKVEGDRFPGTGKRRLYSPGAVIDSAVLTGLVDAGLAAVRVGYFKDTKGKDVLSLGRLGACKILSLKSDSVSNSNQTNKTPFLVIYGAPSPAASTVALPAAPTVALVDETTLLRERCARDAAWLIALNLTKIFQPLRGKIAAVFEDRVVKVELVKDD